MRASGTTTWSEPAASVRLLDDHAPMRLVRGPGGANGWLVLDVGLQRDIGLAGFEAAVVGRAAGDFEFTAADEVGFGQQPAEVDGGDAGLVGVVEEPAACHDERASMPGRGGDAVTPPCARLPAVMGASEGDDQDGVSGSLRESGGILGQVPEKGNASLGG